jgi:hypothetical protein
MTLRDIEWTDLTLTPESTVRRGTPLTQNGAADAIAGVLAVGKPFIVDAFALAQESGQPAEPEMRLLASTHAFPYIRLALSIRPGDTYDVRFVGLDIALESQDDEAICWSMQPMRVDQEIKTRAESKVSSKLKLEIAELGAALTERDEYVVYQPTVEAFNLERADPAWELRPAPGRRLSGIQLLHLIVRMPQATKATARVTLRADISRQGFLWRYTARRAEDREDVCTIALP